jgi:hypothetical protein
MKRHEWQFSSAAAGDTVRLVAACSVCGLVRTLLTPTPGRDKHVDLTGACPGEPQVSEVPRNRSASF